MNPVRGAVIANSGTLAGRLAAARRRSFVGRGTELDLVRRALAADLPPFAVLHVHGPGGIGKTSLLRCFVDDAADAGWVPALLDGRSTRPDPSAFLLDLAVALGLPAHENPLPVLQAGPPTLLVVDTYERLAPLDDWLRDQLLPELPSRSLVVLAGRTPPSPGWRGDPGWTSLLRVVALRNLAPVEAHALLAERGVAAGAWDAVLQLTGGHPLALSLMGDLVTQTGAVPSGLGDAPDVIEGMLERFLLDVPSPVHRDVLELAAHVRVTTPALLRAAVPDTDTDELFTWLRGLSFIDRVPGGVVPHDLARDVLELHHRWRDEDHYRDLHRRARTHSIDRIHRSDGLEQEHAVRDLIFLHRHQPVFAPFLSWQDASAIVARGLSPVDVPEILALTERHEGPSAAPIVRYWLDRQPESAIVFTRPGQPGISGFVVFLDLGEPTDEDLQADPVLASLWSWIRQHGPLRTGECWSLGRFWVFEAGPEGPTPEFDHLQMRSVIRWVTDPTLGWSVVVVSEPRLAMFAPLFEYIDHPRADGAEVTLDGRVRAAFAHDWRVRPVDAWLDLMGEREVALDLDLTAPPRQETLTVLSEPEFAAAVKTALRAVQRPGVLATNPLVRSRVVADRGGADPGGALADLLVEAVDALRDGGTGDKHHRAVATTYFKGAPTQEAAAERLGLPFSTYRRHLTTGVDRVVRWLWDREVHGQ
jgi:hypothetical protein